MNEKELDDFIRASVLKNQLINADVKFMIGLYSDKEEYLHLIDTLIVLMDNDSCFFYLDEDFSDIIQLLVSLHRFDMKGPLKPYFEKINKIIDFTNEVKYTPSAEKKILTSLYASAHQVVRGIEINDDETFGAVLSYDGFVLTALINSDIEAIDNDDLFLSSINYLLQAAPSFFNGKILELAKKRIDLIGTSNKPFDIKRRIKKETQEELEKINIKKYKEE